MTKAQGLDHEDHQWKAADEPADSDSEEEGLQLLLAGISSKQMANVLWPKDDADDDDNNSLKNKVVHVAPAARWKQTGSQNATYRVDPTLLLSSWDFDAERRIMAHSWSYGESGLLGSPSIRIVNFGACRGNGLVVTKSFKKGSTIFTERALFANNMLCTPPACCNCWRSLSSPHHVAANLPDLHLWPTLMSSIQKHKCGSMFCSPKCQSQHQDMFGSCCTLKKCLHLVPKSEEAVGILQLAVLVFVAHVHKFRSTNGSNTNFGVIWDDLCGSPDNIVPLELDESLESIYNGVASIVTLSIEEQLILSQKLFNTFVAMVARNSFEARTKCPFDAYFGSLNRSARSEVAKALGGKLTREINRRIQVDVVVSVAAIFALTARLNHSCDANVQALSQNYMDCHMDIVARRDLEAGEELLISYIPETKIRARRQRILQAKYLFWCDCARCSEEGNANVPSD